MRLRARVDTNQKEIVTELRKRGFEVIHLHKEGKGVPDLLVSSSGEMWLVEVKSLKGKYTMDQLQFFQKWKGKPILTIRSIEDIERLILKSVPR